MRCAIHDRVGQDVMQKRGSGVRRAGHAAEHMSPIRIVCMSDEMLDRHDGKLTDRHVLRGGGRGDVR